MTDIIINDVRPRVQYIQGVDDAVTDTFDYPFPVLNEGDLVVAVDTTILDAADYSVTGVGAEAGGTVILSATPAANARISIWRDMPFQRTTDFAPGADLRAAVLNDELDRTALLLQQAEALVGDSIHRQPYDLDIDLALPPVSVRAGKLLSFDSAGRPETVEAKIPGDITNFALIYLGAHNTVDEPELRLDGLALQVGDLYFNTDQNALKVYSGTEWLVAFVPDGDYLLQDGSVALTGALDLGGNAIGNVSTVDGRDIATDGATLDGFSSAVSQAVTSGASAIGYANAAIDNTIHNAWEIARMDGLAAYAMINTYLDTFTDESGINTGANSNAQYAAAEERYSNADSAVVISDGGYDSQVFDGAGATGSWSGYVGGNGVQNSSFGSVGGKTAWQFYASATAGNTYSGITADIGNWGKEFCASYEIYITDLADMGVLVQGSSPAYQVLNITFILDAGRRTTCRLGGDGQLWIGNDGTQDVGSGAGVIQEATWQTLTLWGRMNTSNQISDFKCWVDGALVIDVSGKSYTTTSTGSDGTTFLQLSGESGSANPKFHIHSARMGKFVVSENDPFYSADYVAASNYATVSTANPGCQSFQVNDTNQITGASFYVHDTTGLPATFDVHIRPDDSGAPDTGSSLASVTGASTPGNNVAGVATVTFDAPFTPATATTYWLCIENASASIRVSVQSSGSYADGNARHSGANQAGADMHFHIIQNRGTGLDMLLVSNAITAASAPSELRLLLDLAAADAAVGENLLTYSEQLDNAAWTQTNVTVTANSATAPDGTETADTLTSTGDGSLDRAITLEAGTDYVFSGYVKRNGGSDVALQMLAADYGGSGVIARQTITATSSWQRFSVAFTTLTGNSHTLSLGDEATFGSGESVYVWGLQLEKASTLGPYRKTDATSTGVVSVANRDFIASASRDGGTTWSAAALEKISLAASSRALYAATVDVSGQPSGTDVRLKLDTANGKSVTLYRWACQADTSLSF